MSTHNESHQIKVIKFVQELLLDEENRVAITPALINEKIEMVLKMNPKWGVELNKQTVIDELIRRFSLWIGHDTTLKNEIGHVHWLVSARKKDWRYWQRYREWQERKLSNTVVDKLDQSTDTVLSLLEDPLRDGPWDRRGLVVGHVQSGKTGHYTGLICKAADAGYKIIIVLAGMHNNLRSQTQVRLDEGFLGYETKPIVEDIRIIGVGEIDGDPAIRPNFATNRSDKGDFSTAAAKNLGITPEQRPWLFVVKKNKTVLERLLRWIRNHVANAVDEHGNKIVTNLPLLIIDDEADHASVDTGEQVFDSEGKPDEEHQPTAINRLIRRILNSYTRAAYVGYTATPFANIFIHERGATREDGPDLFPSSFIVNLAAPSNYVGPARVFGLGEEGDKGLPLIRLISDHSDAEGRGGWMPQKHRNGHVPLHDGLDAMPPSLQEAIQAFILACSIRYLRGQQNEHSSMLVHVTRFNSVQQSVNRQVDEYVRHLRQRITRGIGSEEALRGLSDLYERDFMPTSSIISKELPDAVPIINPTWDEIIEILPDVLSDIQVRMINGTAKDALDYSEHEGAGLKVIAIGGDKLARGLTLEGLCVSYFLRASKMYDTLMQMGRWFGYRPGYLDMCRLYTTSELAEWFGHITLASEELRKEFDLMADSGSTPKEYGLKVASHPILMVTSRVKMRTATSLELSFSGRIVETKTFSEHKKDRERNLECIFNFVKSLGAASEINPKKEWEKFQEDRQGLLWKDVGASKIIEFLGSYYAHPEDYNIDCKLLISFINSMQNHGELSNWYIYLKSAVDGRDYNINHDALIKPLKRKKVNSDAGKYCVNRLVTLRDEGIDLDQSSWIAALNLTQKTWAADPARQRYPDKQEPNVPNGASIRKIRGYGADGVNPHPERGVLFIYPIDMDDLSEVDSSTIPMFGFGISFPESTNAQKVEYAVNNIFREQDNNYAE